jgi:hypothetical protein
VKPLTDREICLYRERLERGRNIAGLTSVNRWIATVDDLKRQLAEVEAENERLKAFVRHLAAAAADLKASGEKAERDRDALADTAHDAWFDGWIACEDAAGIDMSHIRAETFARRIRDARKGDGE